MSFKQPLLFLCSLHDRGRVKQRHIELLFLLGVRENAFAGVIPREDLVHAAEHKNREECRQTDLKTALKKSVWVVLLLLLCVWVCVCHMCMFVVCAVLK